MNFIKKAFQNKNASVVILGILIGVCLIIFGALKESDTQSEVPPKESVQYTTPELESYTKTLEERLESHISQISGVTNVNVLITIDGSGEAVYATEGSNKDYVIIKDASGNENAVKLMEIHANVRGVAVVCDYGGSEALRAEIIEMLSSLFNIGSNRISVMPA